MDAWRRLETSWRAHRSRVPILRQLGYQLGSISKVWDHFDPAITPASPFLEYGAGSVIGLRGGKLEISGISISSSKRAETCSYRRLVVNTARIHRKISPTIRDFVSDRENQPGSKFSISAPAAKIKETMMDAWRCLEVSWRPTGAAISS